MVWKHEQISTKKQTFRVDNVKQMQLFNHFLLHIENIYNIGATEEKTSFRLGLTHPPLFLSFFLFECFVLSFVSACLCLAFDSIRVMAWLTNFLNMHFKNTHGIYNRHFFFVVFYILLWRNMCTICDKIEIVLSLFEKKYIILIVWTPGPNGNCILTRSFFFSSKLWKRKKNV